LRTRSSRPGAIFFTDSLIILAALRVRWSSLQFILGPDHDFRFGPARVFANPSENLSVRLSLLSKGRGCRPISIRKRTRIADLEGSQLNAIASDKPFFCYYVAPRRHSCAGTTQHQNGSRSSSSAAAAAENRFRPADTGQRGAPIRRAGSFAENEAPLVIGASGMEVADISATTVAPAASQARLSSGVERLDAMLGSGYFRGSSVLITSVVESASMVA
jgi:hypothetical protein